MDDQQMHASTFSAAKLAALKPVSNFRSMYESGFWLLPSERGKQLHKLNKPTTALTVHLFPAVQN